MIIRKAVASRACAGGLSLAAVLLSAAIVAWAIQDFSSSINLRLYLYQAGFVAAAGASAVALVLFRGNLGEKPENIYLLCLLLFTCYSSWVFDTNEVSWDMESHYEYVLEYSEPDRIHEFTEADEAIVYREDINILYSAGELSEKDALLDSLDRIEGDTEGAAYGPLRNLYSRVASLPASLLMFVLTSLGVSFSARFVLVKMIYALIYSLVCYFGMRQLVWGKAFYAAVSMVPTLLFIASTYGYDYWLNSCVLLGTATLVGELQRCDTKISLSKIAVMLGAFFLGMGPKAVYFPLILLCLLLPGSKFGSKRGAILYKVAVVVVCSVVLASFAVPRFFVSGLGVGDTRGGSEVNATEQMAFILDNPLEYALIDISFLIDYLSPLATESILNYFAYLGFGPRFVWVGCALLLLVTLVLDRSDSNWLPFPWRARLFALGVFVAVAVIVSSTMYIVFTAVASPVILGCQPRYILPAVFPLLMFLGPSKAIVNMGNKKNLMLVTLTVALALNYASLWFVYVGQLSC